MGFDIILPKVLCKPKFGLHKIRDILGFLRAKITCHLQIEKAVIIIINLEVLILIISFIIIFGDVYIFFVK